MKQEISIPGRSLPVFALMTIMAIIPDLGCEKKPAAAAASSKPNVLLVTFDTTRADYLSCYGHPGNTTPTIDAIAREGIRFANCYTPAPITLPAHASIMTGLYPFQHLLRDNGAGVLDEKAVTLAELFRGAGYRTGGFVGAYVLHSRYGLRQGFDVYSDEFKGSGVHMDDGTEFAERRAQAVSDAALTWVDQKDDRPIFLWVHYFDPHAPYEAPGRAAGGDLSDEYAAEISYADGELGRVVRKVDELSQDANRQAWQVIITDHGEGLGEHGEETHGLFTYNTTLRVALVVKGPGVPKAGVIRTPVSLIDVYPSIAQWLQLPLPYEVAGAELNLTAQTDGKARPLYFETYVPYHKYGWSPLEGVVVGQEKWINAPTAELYDLTTDPGEIKNLAGVRKERTAELAALLVEARRNSPGIPVLSAGKQEFDEASLKKLQSLGYVSSSQEHPEESHSLPDPKEMMEVRRKLMDAERMLAGGDPSGAALLGLVLETDPNNFRALAVLADFVRRPRFRSSLIPVGLARIQKELAPPFDVEVPSAAGLALCMEGQTDAGLEIIAKAERIDANSREVLASRAGCLEQARRLAAQKEADSTDDILQLEQAAASRPPSIPAIEKLASRYLREKNFVEAKRVLRAGVTAAPDHVKLLNSLAMLLATCPDDSVRDGADALRLAKLADERTNHAQPAVLSTLAAAQAETGDFAAAIETATRALERVGDQEAPLKGILTRQIESFKAGKAFRSRTGGKDE
jgi:arylsulfatase A-like enzyme/tetratricopeptide (TPR) repeat protein